MKTISIVNQKGGSAKTTTAVNLASALAEKKKKVLLIDIDPQGSATQWLGASKDDKGLYTVLVDKGNLSNVIIKTGVNNLDIIPASSWLIAADKLLANEVGSETILRKKIGELKKQWDYILIDCPPTLGILSLSALTASQSVIVPLETRIMALQGLVQLTQTIETVRERLNSELFIEGILPCRVDKRTRHSLEIVSELKKRFRDKVYKTFIRENIRLAEAPSFGEPITVYDTKSAGAQDYRDLAKEFIQRSKRKTK